MLKFKKTKANCPLNLFNPVLTVEQFFSKKQHRREIENTKHTSLKQYR